MPFALVSGHAPDFLAGVRKAIERGLPREAALRAVTLAPAEVLGVGDRLGSLEPGKIANVVAWSGEPLTRDAKVKMVFVDGELYEPDDKPSPSRSAAPSPAPTPTAGGARMIAAALAVLALAAAGPGPGRRPRPPRRRSPSWAAPCSPPGRQGTIDNGTVLVRGRQDRRRGSGRARARGRARSSTPPANS